MTLYRSALLLLLGWYCCDLSAQGSDFAETDFAKADSVAGLYAAHSLYDLKELSDKLTIPLCTEQEKFRAIYTWVCSNIEVDYDLVEQHKRKKAKLSGARLAKWNDNFNSRVFKTLLEERKTVCTGYAYVVRELAYHAGLVCRIVNGYAKPGGVSSCDSRPVNHSWNTVMLNGKWYVCDATWSSGLFNMSTRQFVKRYNDFYFLCDPTDFYREHCESKAVYVVKINP